MHVVSESLHGISLPRASLAICENCGIVTFQGATNGEPCRIFIHLLLGSFVIVDVIEGVFMLGVVVRVINISLEVIRRQCF